MSTIARRVAATAALFAAPALIALGTATMSHADSTVTQHGTSISTSPVHHDAFPHQANTPKPGTPEHHRHQNAR
ncbi:hypothetical protein [Mycobacterium sp. URHB0044]|uniref:hypothetical protein n=1 Tax=Mycobacterium sp. URHB0044 TaxID=1380386 RepID=UPI0004910953|nr:hypothetical protein [Mycobacterium sp. URHB0044]